MLVFPVNPTRQTGSRSCPSGGELAVLGDLPQVELLGEVQDCGGLAQAWESIDGDRAFDLVTVLRVGVDDVPHVLVQFAQLRSL
jgi:hypothetical protein